MLKRTLWYLGIVLFFGTLRGLSSEPNPDLPAYYAYIEGYVFMALIWGMIYFNAVISQVPVSGSIKVLLTLMTAMAAGLIAFSFYKTLGSGEVMENIKAGWGDDIESYTEYPIKGYQLVGTLISLLYLVVGVAQWFFSLAQRASTK